MYKTYSRKKQKITNVKFVYEKVLLLVRFDLVPAKLVLFLMLSLAF